nr:CocE/NonD family hydrolase [Paraflavitalea speifideiaquila]
MTRLTAPTFLLLLFTVIAQAQSTTQSKYNRQELMIPMRDGVKLNTVIFTPTAATEKYPFLLRRTPYGVSDAGAPIKGVM